MLRVKNMTGLKIHRLTVISRADNSRNSQARWNCVCDCGNACVVYGSCLRNGHTKSCGCIKIEKSIKRSTKHGHATNGITRTYTTWAGMLNRCNDVNSGSYKNYGGRGIQVCDRWSDFKNFLEDMGEKPIGCSIERIDVNGNYEPNNCRWATIKEQARNKRNNRILIVDGVSATMSEWSEMLGVPPASIQYRLNRGWSDEDAVKKPFNKNNRRMIQYKGETHSLVEWAKILGISLSTFYYHERQGKNTTEILDYLDRT